MGEKAEDLHVDAVRIIKDVFGDSTATLFAKVIATKPQREIPILVKELLEDYLGIVEAKYISYTLSKKYGL